MYTGFTREKNLVFTLKKLGNSKTIKEKGKASAKLRGEGGVFSFWGHVGSVLSILVSFCLKLLNCL